MNPAFGNAPSARSLRGLLAAALLLTAAAAGAQAPVDFNNDSRTDIGDVLTLQLKIAQQPTTESLRRALDLDRDNNLSNIDADYLAQMLIGLVKYLPGFFLDAGTFGDIIVTNQAAVDIGFDVEGVASAFHINKGTSQTLAAGSGPTTGTLQVANLDEGLNIVGLTIFDEAENTSLTRTLEITRDSFPPAVRIDTPTTNAVVQTLDVPVTGQAIDALTDTAVWVNGVLMTIDPDGRFHGTVSFPVGGPRRLTALASDAAGNIDTDAVDIEVYVSPPETKTVGTVRADLPSGAIKTNGETFELASETNTAIKTLLGPGSGGIVAGMPSSGLTDGVIILPNAAMVSLETDDLPPAEEGLANPELFAAKPVLSLQNLTGANGTMPLWIFQIIPDADGDTFPEMALAARARLETTGPLAGRIVPIPPAPGDGLPGMFNPDVPTFDAQTANEQAGDMPGVRKLMARLQARKRAAPGSNPQARVTFYCCAASAIIPVIGKAECIAIGIDRVSEEIEDHKTEMMFLSSAMRARSNTIINAAQDRLDAADSLFGTVRGTRIISVTQGKLFGCVGNFFTGGAVTAANEAISNVNNVLDDMQDLRAFMEQNPDRPVQEYIARWGSRAVDYFGSQAFLRGMAAKDLKTYSGALGSVNKLRVMKGLLGKLSFINDCGTALANIAQGIGNWRLLSRKNDELDQAMAQYDVHLNRFRALADCKRALVASMSPNPAPDPAFAKDRWLKPLQAGVDTIDARLVALETLVHDGDHLHHHDEEFLTEALEVLDAGQILTAADLLPYVDALIHASEETIEFSQRGAAYTQGIDAWREFTAIDEAAVARMKADADLLEGTNASVFAAQGGLGDAAMSFQGTGAPFTVQTRTGGEFTHYIFTTLTTDPAGASGRQAHLDGRPFTLNGASDDGLMTGTKGGTVPTLDFPFTPFTTVDFNSVVDIGTIRLGGNLVDNGTQPPTVSIQFPPNGYQVPAGFPLLVQTQSADDAAVLGVDVALNGVSQIGLSGGISKGVVKIGSALGSYTIRATAIDPGDRTAAAQVTVQAVDPTGAFTIEPTVVRLEANEPQQFTAKFRGAPAAGVVWKVNGFEGGKESLVGTVSGSGLYDPSTADFGGVSAAIVQVQAELPAFPGLQATARVLIVDSRNVFSSPVAFSFPAAGALGGLLVSRPLAFSFADPSGPGGLLVSRPLAFSFSAPGAPGGLLTGAPIAFDRQ